MIDSFSKYTKLSGKLTFLTPFICTRTCAFQGVRNVSFSETFAYLLNEWSHSNDKQLLNPYLEDVHLSLNIYWKKGRKNLKIGDYTLKVSIFVGIKDIFT